MAMLTTSGGPRGLHLLELTGHILQHDLELTLDGEWETVRDDAKCQQLRTSIPAQAWQGFRFQKTIRIALTSWADTRVLIQAAGIEEKLRDALKKKLKATRMPSTPVAAIEPRSPPSEPRTGGIADRQEIDGVMCQHARSIQLTKERDEALKLCDRMRTSTQRMLNSLDFLIRKGMHAPRADGPDSLHRTPLHVIMPAPTSSGSDLPLFIAPTLEVTFTHQMELSNDIFTTGLIQTAQLAFGNKMLQPALPLEQLDWADVDLDFLLFGQDQQQLMRLHATMAGDEFVGRDGMADLHTALKNLDWSEVPPTIRLHLTPCVLGGAGEGKENEGPGARRRSRSPFPMFKKLKTNAPLTKEMSSNILIDSAPPQPTETQPKPPQHPRSFLKQPSTSGSSREQDGGRALAAQSIVWHVADPSLAVPILDVESAWHQELLKCDDTQEMLPLIVAFLEQAAPRGDRVSRPGVYETAQCSTPLDLTKAVTTAFPLTKRHGVEHFAGGTSWKVQMLPTSAHATVLADVIAHAPYHILPKCIITTGPEGHGVRREVPCISAAKAYYSKPKPKVRS